MVAGEGDSRWLLSRDFGEAEGVEHAAGLSRSVTVRKVVVQSSLKILQLGPCGLRSGEWDEEREAGCGCSHTW